MNHPDHHAFALIAEDQRVNKKPALPYKTTQAHVLLTGSGSHWAPPKVFVPSNTDVQKTITEALLETHGLTMSVLHPVGPIFSAGMTIVGKEESARAYQCIKNYAAKTSYRTTLKKSRWFTPREINQERFKDGEQIQRLKINDITRLMIMDAFYLLSRPSVEQSEVVTDGYEYSENNSEFILGTGTSLLRYKREWREYSAL